MRARGRKNFDIGDAVLGEREPGLVFHPGQKLGGVERQSGALMPARANVDPN